MANRDQYLCSQTIVVSRAYVSWQDNSQLEVHFFPRFETIDSGKWQTGNLFAISYLV